MSDASYVPETRDLDEGDVRAILREASVPGVVAEALQRFRAADGFSYARSLAFQTVLTTIPGVILAVAIAVRTGQGRFRSLILAVIDSIGQGPAGDVIRTALEQGSDTSGSNLLVMFSAALATIASGTSAMAQLQRGASRIYGIDADRAFRRRYGLALLLMLTAGTLIAVAFIAFAVGETGSNGSGSDGATEIWAIVRWPVGVVAIVLGLATLFKAAPNRVQPTRRWLTTGAVIALVAWVLSTLGLLAYVNLSTTFGDTYGPLAGLIGFMLWAQFSSIAIFYGLAFAAQLEARRSGITSPIL